jgi:hypothetical protein
MLIAGNPAPLAGNLQTENACKTPSRREEVAAKPILHHIQLKTETQRTWPPTSNPKNGSAFSVSSAVKTLPPSLP